MTIAPLGVGRRAGDFIRLLAEMIVAGLAGNGRRSLVTDEIGAAAAAAGAVRATVALGSDEGSVTVFFAHSTDP